MTSSINKRCWAEIDLAALEHNIAVIHALIGKKSGQNAGIMAIVKANAYGHGALPIARALDSRVDSFGVANIGEALQIAGAIVPGRIHILGAALPGEREEIVRGSFVPVVSSLEEALAYDRLVTAAPFPVNVAIDTGMGRLGIRAGEAVAEIEKIARLPRLRIHTIATHLPSADEDEAFTRDQLALFDRLVAQLRAAGITAPRIHSLNSAGAIVFPGSAHDFARIGLAMYGSSPIPAFQEKLRAVMTLKAHVTIVRDLPAGEGISYGRTFITPAPMRVATLGVGYADGYQRRLSGQGTQVLVRGTRCPVLGRVTMDQIMIDVTHLPGVDVGEEVVLFGRQGGDEIFAADLAAKAGTIPWEIFTGISQRVERFYLHPPSASAQP